ncbi:leucyl aminopeptidase family protein [Nocardioides panacisoli]|uniref:leucyl aminopeptidase family protein n=1 Tax=Nocardioides panacisoli TaxID=627624 RepID=UPI001C62AD16|nr:leucyl aminopeptidase family protein [Nocardioides panacisoli]QYJ02444.1 leucyl aminopeptidase family protein [Nocardioides panacisoli]
MTAAVLPHQVTPPEFTLSELGPAAVAGADVIAVPVLNGSDAQGLVLGPGAADVADATGVDLLDAAEVHRMAGAVGEVALVPVAPTPANADLQAVALVGVGAARPIDVRRAGAALARRVKDRATVATSIPAVVPDVPDDSADDPSVAHTVEELVEAFVAGATLGSFGFAWRAEGPTEQPVRRVTIAGVGAIDPATLPRAVAIARAGWRSRLLATVPSNVKNPGWLAEQAEEIATEHGLACTVWDEERLAADGFGGILAVGKASATPPRLIRLDYTPEGVGARAARKLPHVVLVGKGITFDSGGLSLKPGQAMASMKRDMTGGGVVLATMAALGAVGCPVRVTGLVPAAENAVSGDALRPGDVIRHYGGTTSEVTNTDAEGRLVLADALAYAVAELGPDVMVDVATLTGAVKVALGQQVGGLYANGDALAAALRAAGDRAGEPLWRLPLYDGYRSRLDSSIADLDNAPGSAGSITAALFLQHFVGDVPWAHLDIASVGDVESDWHEWTAGPSGFGARLLLHWLRSADLVHGVA